MKGRRRQNPKRTHYAWRPSEYTREMFEDFLQEYPYINQTPFLDVALAYYLECVMVHGFDMKTLKPRVPPVQQKRK